MSAAGGAAAAPAIAGKGNRIASALIGGSGTFDELIAMKQAGFDDEDMLQRLYATGQVFDLTPKQKQSLIDAGISPFVAVEMTRINESEKNRVLATAQKSD